MRFIRVFLAWCGFPRPSRPEDIPLKLDADTLAQVMEEAQKLRSGHQVDVKPLARGEIPVPRRAEDE